MASQSDLVGKAVGEALKYIEQNAPEEHKKLNAEPDKKAKIVQAARDTATETLRLTDEFRRQPTKDIAEILSMYLSEDRINLIRGGLKIPTFRLTITKQDNDQYLVSFAREGEMFQPSRAIASVVDVDWATFQQYASIVVEAVLLILSVVGMSLSPEKEVIKKVIDEATKAIQDSSKLANAIENFFKAWKAAEGNTMQEAEAIFNLLKDIYLSGILLMLIQSLCSNMSWFDWLLTVVRVIAMLVASLGTDGLALIAEISLAVLNLVDFLTKIANVFQLSEIKKTLKKLSLVASVH